MAKSPQDQWPQHCRSIMTLQRIDVANQQAHVRISTVVIMPLHLYNSLQHQPDVATAIDSIGA